MGGVNLLQLSSGLGPSLDLEVSVVKVLHVLLTCSQMQESLSVAPSPPVPTLFLYSPSSFPTPALLRLPHLGLPRFLGR